MPFALRASKIEWKRCVPYTARAALVTSIVAFLATRVVMAGAGAVRFLSFEEVREIVSGFASSGAPGDLPDANSWVHWIGACDTDIRGRVDRGFEDSISNLILYGGSFTARPRVESAEAAIALEGGLTAAARARVADFAAALAREPKNERLRFTTNFLARRGVVESAAQPVLAANLSRFATEQRAYQETLDAVVKTGDPGQLLFARSTLYRERGLSVDTSLLPNYAIEDTLRAMLRKGALSPGAIRRVAIVGPGLDFADKRGGYDYYPLQTIQPFAVVEAVARLGLGAPAQVEVTAFDLNPAVLAHVRELADRARAGRAYIIQLPRDAQGGWNAETIAYWRHFGEVMGDPAAVIATPPSLKGGILARAVAVRARYAMRLNAVDLDVVTQTMDTQPGNGFDLVVATNILVYYDLFHQALAKAAIARMMNPGGILVVNHALPTQPASLFEYVGRRTVLYSSTAAFGDDIVVYRRRKTSLN